MATVTWIGLGQMGRPMAKNLVTAGHQVRGIEVNPQAAAAAAAAGVQVQDDLIAALDGADFVFTMLPNGALVKQVLAGPDGVLARVTHSTVVIDSSTIDVETCRELHELAHSSNRLFLDAPVSGGVSGAAAGTLTIMIGGEAPVVESALPLLRDLGRFVAHVGAGGAGQSTKIVNNMILGICLAATCEGVALAERLGLDTKVLFDIVSRSSGDNWALRTWYPVPGVVESAASNRDFVPGFATSLLVKDLSLAVAAGDATGSPLAAAHTTLSLFSDHMEAGGAQLDCSSLINALRSQSVTAGSADDVNAPMTPGGNTAKGTAEA